MCLQIKIRNENMNTDVIVCQVWEYDDVNNTADPQQTAESSFYPPYELQDFIWQNLVSVNESDHTVKLCGGENTESFLNGSICLQVSRTTATRSDPPAQNLS